MTKYQLQWTTKKNTNYNGQQRRIPVTGDNIRNTDHKAQYKNTTYREHYKNTTNRQQ